MRGLPRHHMLDPTGNSPALQLPSQFQVLGFAFQVPNPQSATGMVGREAEIAELHTWLDKALQGERQIVFVTDEPGIGKTTLVDTFLDQIAADGSVWLGRGQCIEHYGAGEAYLPVLEALGRLCREPDGKRLIELLAQQAPTWLVQMPALLSAAELEALQRKVLGATPDRPGIVLVQRQSAAHPFRSCPWRSSARAPARRAKAA
jgi:hypothetical protein